MFLHHRLLFTAAFVITSLLQTVIGLRLFLICQTMPIDNTNQQCDQYGDPLPAHAIARMGTVRLRHHQPLALAFSSSKAVLACSTGDEICLWNIRTGEQIQRIPYPSCGCMIFSPDDKLLAFNGSQGDIVLWDINSRKETRRLIGHKATVKAIAFSPQGNRLASGGSDGVMSMWDVSNGTRPWQVLINEEEVCCLAFASNGKSLAVGTKNGLIRLCDAATGKELLKPLRHGGALRALAFTPDGKSLASAGVTSTTLGLAEVNVWEVGSGKNVSKYKAQDLLDLAGLALAPDGDTVAMARVGANGVEIRSTTKDQVIRKLSIPNFVTIIAYSSDGKLLATAALSSAIQIWDPNTESQIHPLGGHQHRVTAAVFAGKDKSIVTASKEAVILWHCQTGKEILRLCGAVKYDPVIAASTDGRFVAIASETISVWDLTEKRLIKTFPVEWLGRRCLTFSPDGRYILSCGSKEVLASWDIVSGNTKETSGTPIPLMELTVLDRVAVSGKDKTVTAVGFDVMNLHLFFCQWDLTLTKRKTLVHDKSTGPVNMVRVSADGELIAYADEEDCIRLWQASTKKEIRRIKTHEVDKKAVRKLTAMAFSPDGRTLATGGGDGSIWLWEVATGRERVRLLGHQGRIRDLAFSLDGTMLVSAGDDTTALVWRI